MAQMWLSFRDFVETEPSFSTKVHFGTIVEVPGGGEGGTVGPPGSLTKSVRNFELKEKACPL